MRLTDDEKNEFIRKVLFSRLRILNDYGFFGLLLMNMKFEIVEKINVGSTNGKTIFISVNFLKNAENREIDFFMLHEIMHIALKHIYRRGKRDIKAFNIACDIVVNSNILYTYNMDTKLITFNGKEVIHKINGKEGYLFTAEEVYELLLKSGELEEASNYDCHDYWNENKSEYEDEFNLNQKILNAANALRIKNSNCNLSPGITRMLKDLYNNSIDWHEILADFLTFDNYDYIFAPPDRRYLEFSFFLPSFNQLEENLDIKVLFEIDTSASMSDEEITKAYSEIKSAIEYANGGLKGFLGFYDCTAYDPIEFVDESDLLNIKPKGGGGTSVTAVFNKLNYFESITGQIDLIIIITDGYDAFPNENVRKNIPVLWLITNDKITPPWGTIARIK